MLIPSRDDIVDIFLSMAKDQKLESINNNGHVVINSRVGAISIDVGSEYTKIALDGKPKGSFHNSSESRKRAEHVVENILG